MSTGDAGSGGVRAPDGPRVTATAVHPGAVYRIEDEDRTVAVASGLPGDAGPGSRNAAVGLAPSRRDPRSGRSTRGTALDGPGDEAWDAVLAGDPDALVVLRRPRDADAVPDGLPPEVYVPAGDTALPPGLDGAEPLNDGDAVATPNATVRARSVEPARRGTVGLDVRAGDRRALLAGPLTGGVRSLLPDGRTEGDRLVDRLDDGSDERVDLLAVGAGTDRDGFRRVVREARPRAVHVTGPGERRGGDWETERLLRCARASCRDARTVDPWNAPVTVTLGDELLVDGRETWREGDEERGARARG